jgi:hypothetical protein
MSVCMFLQADTNSSDTHRCAQRIVTFPSSFEAPQAKVVSSTPPCIRQPWPRREHSCAARQGACSHADARSRLRIVSFASHACVACVRCLSLSPSHTLLHHTTNQIIKTSDTRNLRPNPSTNLYIVNPEPESLKPKDYARIR